MLNQIAEWILAIPNSVPILLGAEPHNAMLVRAIAAILFIVFIVYLVAMRPFRSFFSNIANKIRGSDKRN
jgi:F0F1-type ATP synthase membrane subunit b/b'